MPFSSRLGVSTIPTRESVIRDWSLESDSKKFALDLVGDAEETTKNRRNPSSAVGMRQNLTAIWAGSPSNYDDYSVHRRFAISRAFGGEGCSNHLNRSKYVMGTAINHAAAMRRLESLFSDAKLETKSPSPPREIHVEIEKSSDANCDVHGRNTRNGRRGSVEINGLRKNSANGSHQSLYRKDSGGWNGQKRDLVFNGMGPRRDSMPVISNHLTYYNRRDSLNLPQQPPKKEMEHPSQFSSTLRKDDLSTSTGSLARKDVNGNRWHHRRDSLGSTNSLKRDYLNVPTLRRNSRNFSTDSLDGRRNSWDPGRRGSTSSNCCKEYVREIIKRKVGMIIIEDMLVEGVLTM
ncbi:hypothetical protein WA026_016969 [Henosepilachna vigintioctopunctata]|uniref:Uncharacterized protein n=1 Tax=Henosepilachna vigintioctopunctata TaxID=420089 RepID=A0AAW1U931_9CUCU